MDPRFVALAALSDADINLAEGALLIAAGQYPDLDIAHWLGVIDDLGARARERMPKDADWTLQLSIINHLLFREEGFTGAEVEAFDPRDSFLNDVLTRKSGIAISLSVIFMEIGRRAGLDVQGVSFPGHFLVKMAVEDGEVVIDPYNGGIPLTRDQLQARLNMVYPEPPRPALEEVLRTAGNKQILARFLRNLKTWYLHQSEWLLALSALDRILLLEPDNLHELRERGEVYWQLECFRAAYADLSQFIALAPESNEADELRVRLVELQQRLASLN